MDWPSWCCDRKGRVWQQATIEIMRRNHSSHTLIILFNRSQANSGRDYTPQYVRASYMWVLFFAHIPFVVDRTFNVTPTERLQHWLKNSGSKISTVKQLQ